MSVGPTAATSEEDVLFGQAYEIQASAKFNIIYCHSLSLSKTGLFRMSHLDGMTGEGGDTLILTNLLLFNVENFTLRWLDIFYFLLDARQKFEQ